MNQLEHTEQVNLMKWWALACRAYQLDERMLFAIPNGGQRNIIVAAKMKQEGVRSGIPDLFLAVPKKDYHGLFIEMKKVKGGRVSENQKEIARNRGVVRMLWGEQICAFCGLQKISDKNSKNIKKHLQFVQFCDIINRMPYSIRGSDGCFSGKEAKIHLTVTQEPH